MANWLTTNHRPAEHPAERIDTDVDRQLRHMDIVLSLAALTLLGLPLCLGLLAGKLHAVNYQGRHNKVFKRWQIKFPDSYLGRLFKRTGMHAWPVLLNILKGEMAWVGHRPVCADSDKATATALTQAKPGVISIWAMRQRMAVDFGTELEADLEYLTRRGCRHDLGLLLRALLLIWVPASHAATASRICVGDVSFDNLNMTQAIARISHMLDGTTAQQVSFVNAACVNIAARDRGYRRLLARASLVLPDGIGLKIAADLLGAPIKQNVNGTDLFPRLCEMFEKRGARVFLLGGQAGVAQRVTEVIHEQWPKLSIVGARDGFFTVAEEGAVAAEVCATGADVLLVARGVPMQDVFIDRHLHQLGVKVAIGVGGLFDFVSGRIHRAPAWMRDSGLEWIYRLRQEPSRMWQRYLVGNLTFLGRIILQRLGLRSSARDELPDENSTQAARMAEVHTLRTVLFATSTSPLDVPIPSDFPAALLPFGWNTLIERAIEQLANLGIQHIDLVVCSRPEAFRQLLGHGERWGVQLQWHLAKDATTPYGLFHSLGFSQGQRVLLGHADRLVSSHVLSALIEHDQMAAISNDQTGVSWAGWGSTTAAWLTPYALHSDEAAMGIHLCQNSTHLTVLDEDEFININDAAELLKVQQLSMTSDQLSKVPATWLHTPWGAQSPDAVVHINAIMEGPVLIGPGCFIAAGARIGPGTLLSRDVVISSGATVTNSLVLPGTFVGTGLELDETVVNGRQVQHLRLAVRTVLPATDGLLLDLHSPRTTAANWLSRATATIACLLFLPWLMVDTALRHAQGLSLRWQRRSVALGRSIDTGEILLQTLRCTPTSGHGAGHLLAHFGEWMDVAAGHRTWFGSRPRSQAEWYALGRDWQLLLSPTSIGCLHAPAWSEAGAESVEARAAADVFFAVKPSVRIKMQILWSLIRNTTSTITK